MRTRIAFVVAWLVLLGAISAMSQEPDSIHAGGNDPNLPQPESKAEALSGTPQLTVQDSEAVKKRDFVAPGVPEKVERYTNYRSKYFTIRFGFAALADYNGFWQDTDSIAQVGRQHDQWDDRSTRFILIRDYRA